MRNDTFRAAARIIFDALHAQGVGAVYVSYYGGGDSGDVEAPEYSRDEEDMTTAVVPFASDWPTGKVAIPARRWADGGYKIIMVETSIDEAVSNLVLEAANARHPGWYNDEGGEGSVTLDVKTRRIIVDHGTYVQQTEWDKYSIDLNADNEDGDSTGEVT